MSIAMPNDFHDTIPALLNEQRIPRNRRINGCGVAGLLLCAVSAVAVALGIAALLGAVL